MTAVEGDTGDRPGGRTRVKICGLTRERDVRRAVAAGADCLGVIVDVSVETPREVGVERARTLFGDVPPGVTTVLVTMASTTGRVRDLVERVEPDAVQLHGGVSPQRVLRIGSALPVDVLVAVDAADREAMRRYDGVADALLVDSLDADGAGGTGEAHDWARTAEAVTELSAPVFLAGGLTPDTVAEAVETVGPYAVDVASGVERTGGQKDHDAVTRFVRAASEAGGPDHGTSGPAGRERADGVEP
jgi:phosphoribosylanthranilate isomerase